MNRPDTVKKNVQSFDNDVLVSGSYAYTQERLSSKTANANTSAAIAAAVPFAGKRVLDLGCGDGAYTVDFAALGVESVLGIDPVAAAVEAASARAKKLGVDAKVRFEVGNIYEIDGILREGGFDCIVLRGVLHHLPDPERAIATLAGFRGSVVVLEPNGLNPLLKLIERFSAYHVEHEERSFSPSLIRKWLRSAGFEIIETRVLNLVPIFCPDWMARSLNQVGPLVEHIPLLRDIACGQVLISARG